METILKIEEYKITDGPLKIENIHVLQGANYFSGGPVVRFRLNLGDYNEVFTNTIPNFFEKLQAKVPSLYEHHCSPGRPGGFFERVKEGTLLGHVMEHVAIELQTLAGMDVGFGKTRVTKKEGVYNVVFRYFDELAGILAGKASVNLLNSFLLGTDFNVDEIIQKLIYIREKRLLGPSTQAIVDEADLREIPYLRLDKYNQVQLGTGKYRRIIRATTTDKTSLIAVETVDNKYMTNSILYEAGIPVPERIVSDNFEIISGFFENLGKPVVIKPLSGYQGKHVSINIQNEKKLKTAFNYVQEFDEYVVCQEFIEGHAYRLLVIDHQFVAAVQLEPPYIIGDGKLKISQLIENLNTEAEREIGDKGKLSKVLVDGDVLKILELKDYKLETVLKKGEKLFLRNTGNMRLGASSKDITVEVNEFNRFIAERISKTLNLDVAGVDIISNDISVPLIENNARVIEVNAAPDFRMHLQPTYGQPRKVQKDFLNMLFPPKEKSQIPIISVTGAKGKGLTVNIIDKCLKESGLKNGVVRNSGLYIDGICLKNVDMYNAENQQIVLKDSSVDCAVFETPVEMILNHGIGYKYADIGIVLNLFEKEEYYLYDHMRDLEDVAYAKSVVAEEVQEKGTTILNADYPHIHEMSKRLYSKLIFFSKDPTNEYIISHVNKNGKAFLLENGQIVYFTKYEKTPIIEFSSIAALQNLGEDFAIDVALASVAALHVLDVEFEMISKILKEPLSA